MTKLQSRSTPLDAAKFAEIAAECARICGVDVRLTPLAEVPIQVGPSLSAPESAPAAAPSGRTVACLGVRFDDEYVIVRLPTGGFRAFKVDGEGRVVLRLGVRGGFRAHASRVFGALIWDRLKQGRSRYEPQLELLPVEAAAPLVAEAAHLADLEPVAATTQYEASPPRAKTQARESPPSSPSPPLAAAAAGRGPESPVPSGSPTGVPAPAMIPASPTSGPGSPSSNPGAPLARRLRGTRAR